jgi:hypothetical protein
VNECDAIVAAEGTVSQFGHYYNIHEVFDYAFMHFLRIFPSNFPLLSIIVNATMFIHVITVLFIFTYTRFIITQI